MMINKYNTESIIQTSVSLHFILFQALPSGRIGLCDLKFQYDIQYIFKITGMDYNISLEDEKDAYSPQSQPMSYNSTQFQNGEFKSAETNPEPPSYEEKNNFQHMEVTQAPTGLTRFCQLQFYEQYFRVSQLDVTQRIKLSFIPIKNTFIESIGSNPDFYGPFWILTTIIFLLSSTGNLSRYFYNWEKDAYIFKLELVRYGVMIVYSFGFGVPVMLYFIIKFLGGTKISLPQMICLYGYSFSCFIPIFLLCIIPVQALQWLLIAYGMINTIVFLIFNIRDYLQQLDPPKMYVVFGLIVGAQAALFLTFKLVFFKMVYQTNQ